MHENLLRHALLAWALYHFGWTPIEKPDGSLSADDFWQARGLSIWEAPLAELLQVGSAAARGRLVLGIYDGALRLEGSPETRIVISVLRGGRWHGLGSVSTWDAAAVLVSPNARPVLRLAPPGE